MKSLKNLLTKTNNYNPTRLKYSAIGTVIFYLAANGFILFNYIPQHDDLNYVGNFGEIWALRLGKFLVPAYGYFRGILTTPLLIGIISMICLSVMVYVLVDLLEINKPFFILLTAGFLSANITQTENLSSFLFLEDVFMVSAMLACLSVFISQKKDGTKWKMISVLCMVSSMGLYQAYLSFAITFVLILFLKKVLKKGKVCKEDFICSFQAGLLLILSAIIYFIINKTVLALTGLHEPTDYHNLSSLLQDLGVLPYRLYVAYGSKFSMFFVRKGMGLGRIGNCLLVIIIALIIHLFASKKQMTVKDRIIFLLLLFVSTGSALMFNIGAGMVAYRLSFAIYLYYIFAISLLETLIEEPDISTKSLVLTSVSVCSLCLVIWSNLVYSNGAYTTQKVIFDRSISLYTRVLDDIYEVPEYVHNRTPIIILGDYTFDDYAYTLSKKEYQDLGTFRNTSVTYPLTVKNLMRYLGEEVNMILDENTTKKIAEKQETKDMPTFPNKGYIQMIDDYLVINF